VLPLRDNNPTRRTAVVTVVLIAACIGIYFFVQPSGQGAVVDQEDAVSELTFTVETAAIPCEVVRGRPLTKDEVDRTFEQGDTNACDTAPRGQPFARGKPVYLAMLYSMFLHGGLVHLGGNMLFLWVFGNNIEDRMGKVPYVLFYLASGIAATFAHVAADPTSSVPVVGASGAVAGVMGAYLVLYPRVRIHTLFIFILIMFREIPAWVLLGFWFVSQFFIAPGSGVAWVAHVGGFVFGVLGGLILKATGPRARRPALV